MQLAQHPGGRGGKQQIIVVRERTGFSQAAQTDATLQRKNYDDGDKKQQASQESRR